MVMMVVVLLCCVKQKAVKVHYSLSKCHNIMQEGASCVCFWLLKSTLCFQLGDLTLINQLHPFSNIPLPINYSL